MTDQASATGDGPASPVAHIDTITTALHLPPFWANDPVLWFGQVEAQFTARHITSQATRFGHVLAALPPEVALEIRDLILTPPTERPYDVVKEELIRRTACSEQRRLQQLLHAEELGDRKPTQLLRRMRQLLGSDTADAPILKQLFLQRLPTQVQIVLAAAGNISLEEQARLADKIMDLTDSANPRLNASFQPSRPVTAETRFALARCEPAPPAPESILATVSSLSVSVNQLQASINNLTGLMTALVTRDRDRSPSPAPRRRRPRRFASPRRSPGPRRRPVGSLCWYHHNFGATARNCQPPCSWSGNPSPGDQ